MMAPSVAAPVSRGALASADPRAAPGTAAAAPAAPSFLLTSDERADGGLDSALGGSTSTDKGNNSRCSSMSDGESYECYGEGDVDPDSPVQRRLHGDGRDGADGGRDANRSPPGLRRSTWQRTSLRRPPTSNPDSLPNRRWGSFRHAGKRAALGSNALARPPTFPCCSQLYRSSSFNSSGRSSTCDTADDLYSDASLEEDVLDLNHKVQMLQQQVGVLADNQTSTDERYTRAKQDNAALQARVLMLEEQLRETELRAEERLQDEQKRHRELMVRVEREKQLELENCAIRLQTAELEATTLREEGGRLRHQADQLRAEKHRVQDALVDAESALAALRDEMAQQKDDFRQREAEHQQREQLVEELSLELERQREAERAHRQSSRRPDQDSDNLAQVVALSAQLEHVREEARSLREANEELQALVLTRGVEEGRSLLTGSMGSSSLAAELEAMSQDEIRQALKEQQDMNTQLRQYIDGILINIIENYPELLEVRKP
ncbi:rab11 family-interacting protein 4 isoform X3 [Thrips palmi]|uniref:Rab11 family-interacting protein 4 isoform X3 n=1 Tax=Thrips palmi TaxID=161013 RepID=A0A6P8ZZG7_THRPL|nr:rab11 family-interacting protein 4 isoform X3 [Thrips palmi]